MLAVLLALAAAAGYGGSDYTAGLGARRASVIRITITGEAASLVVLALVLPWTNLRSPSPVSLAWGAAGGMAGALGAMALYVGYRHAAFSIAGPLSAVAAAGFSVLVGLLLGERPSGLSLAGIVLALPAIVGVSVSAGGDTAGRNSADPAASGDGAAGPAGPTGASGPTGAGGAGGVAGGDSVEPGLASSGRPAAGVLWGLAAGACFAVLFISLNRAGSGTGLWPVAAAQAAAMVMVGCIGVVTGDLHLPGVGARSLAVWSGATGGGGTILYFLATHDGLLAVTAVLTSLYPAVSIVLARVLIGERLTKIRLAGLFLAAASVGLIAVGGAG